MHDELFTLQTNVDCNHLLAKVAEVPISSQCTTERDSEDSKLTAPEVKRLLLRQVPMP
jgi:hypothetical protein